MAKGKTVLDLTEAAKVDVQHDTFDIRPEDRQALATCGVNNLKEAFDALLGSPKGPAEFDLCHLRRPKYPDTEVISAAASDRIEKALAKHPTTSVAFAENFKVQASARAHKVIGGVRGWLNERI